MIGACCDLHDAALDHSFDLGTFVAGNWQFAGCVAADHPVLAPVLFAAVAGPIGLALYWFGPKRRATSAASGMVMIIHSTSESPEVADRIIAKINEHRAAQGKPPL